VRYDYLILATGARHSFSDTTNLKSLLRIEKAWPIAVGIRNKILGAFEQPRRKKM